MVPVISSYKDYILRSDCGQTVMAMATSRVQLRPGCTPSVHPSLLLLLISCLTAASWALPVEPSAGPSEIPVEIQMPPDQWSDQVIYDQRQNGTENYRVQMSGVTVVLAPAEALMNFAPSDLMMDPGAKPKNVNPTQPKSRLTNLLLGFFNKNH